MSISERKLVTEEEAPARRVEIFIGAGRQINFANERRSELR